MAAINTTISPEDREEIRAVITSQIEHAKKDSVMLEEASKPIAPENAIGRISRMDAINDKSVSEAALRQTREKLIWLENVLGTIDKPSFCLCLRCGLPIPKGRILLMPHSTKCTKCA
jgi:DnaK suppressor protein